MIDKYDRQTHTEKDEISTDMEKVLWNFLLQIFLDLLKSLIISSCS